ncbi:MAG: ribonuclease E/G, partial [Flavobacteriales bacterium]
MSYELVIKSGGTGVELALLQDKKLLELHREKQNNKFNVGDIYLGKVKKIVPGLNAAFINVGYEKDAFLHYLDLGPQFNSQSKFTRKILKGEFKSAHLGSVRLDPDIAKEGKITQVLSNAQHIMVQIAKEPISAKGPRLSSEITLAGRYLVLVPFLNKVSVSQKIKNAEERDRLRKIISGIKPLNHG